MKLLSITFASAAILAAASFGAQAQQAPRQETPGVSQGAPSQEGGQRSQSSRPEPTQGAGQGSSRETQTQGAGNRETQSQSGGTNERPKTGERTGAGDNKAAQQGAPEKSGDKADRKADKPEGGMNKDTAQDQKPDSDRSKAADQQKPDGDRSKAADQQKGDSAKPERQASKEIKPEQKTVIKETIVKQNIRPERINVQVRVGVAIPRTVHLHPLPPTLIEIYPSYRSYKLVMIDDNTILVIDPDTWMIVDVIEV
jgi:hypothetical protein